MPKLVDHAARRAEIADAVRRVVLREGTAAATVRGVAEEAGWSPGAVRYYFPDQGALLRLVIALTFEEVPARVVVHLRRWFADPQVRAEPLDAAQALLEELLPLDDARRVELHVWLATLDAARHDPGLAGSRELTWLGMRQVARIATLWVRRRELDPDVGRLMHEPLTDADDEQVAAALQAVVDGLSVQGFYRPEEMGPAQTRHTLRAHLEQVARGA